MNIQDIKIPLRHLEDFGSEDVMCSDCGDFAFDGVDLFDGQRICNECARYLEELHNDKKCS